MKKINQWCFSILRGVKRKLRFNIGAYQHAKKIAIQNAQAEQSRAVEALREHLQILIGNLGFRCQYRHVPIPISFACNSTISDKKPMKSEVNRIIQILLYIGNLVSDVNIGMFQFRYLLHATQEFPSERR